MLVDGVNVKEYTQKALRNKIGYVSQKAVLFTGSIKATLPMEIMVQKALLMMLLSRQLRLRRQRNL